LIISAIFTALITVLNMAQSAATGATNTNPLFAPANSANPQKYLCCLFGLIPAPTFQHRQIINTSSTTTTSSSDIHASINPNESSLSNLLDVLSGICDSQANSQLNSEYSQLAAEAPILQPHIQLQAQIDSNNSSTSTLQNKQDRANKLLQSRLETLNRSVNPQLMNSKYRTFSEYAAIYKPRNFVDVAGNELHFTKQIVPGNVGLTTAEYLYFVGTALLPSKTDSFVRPITTIPVYNSDRRGNPLNIQNSNVSSVLTLMGFQFSYDYLLEGYEFRCVDNVDIRVYQVVKLDRAFDLSSVQPMRNVKHLLVEIRGLGSEDELKQTQNKLWKYAKSLDPIVKFTKVGPS
jgi:hypothetical protein